MSNIRILIADDQGLIRESLSIVLGLEEDIEVAGVAENGRQAVELCERLQPDVVLMDINMPELDGVEAAREVKSRWPDIKVVMLTSYQEVDHVVNALNYGAEGFLLKAIDPKSLAGSIRLVHSGGTFVSKEMAEKVIRSVTSAKNDSAGAAGHPASGGVFATAGEGDKYGFTPRELEILQLLAKGMRNVDIAERLFLTEGTVKNYISNVYSKLEVSGRWDAVKKAKAEGIVTE
ncbi:response regulator transcription factor [Paenibacillus thermotolerans]|uniref:response regulator transcription factor n=1 Tax=Paenibacillus thermotolerans TaxID=3027807 RepID=UPI00236771EA|nr:MULTISPECIES: response regulator transcription factor [unclassified Paenibacillus]